MQNLSDTFFKGLGLTALSLGLAIGGCSGEASDDDDTTPEPATDTPATPTPATPTPATPTPATPTPATPTPEDGPGIAIIAPNRQSVPLGTDPDLSVGLTIAVTGFTLADPNGDAETGCNGADNCGHVHIFIDGTDGNQPGAPYNNIGFTPQVNALFAYVSEPVGQHTVTIQLVNDDHSPVLVNGETVVAEKAVTTTIAVPSINIIGTGEGDIVEPVNNDTYSFPLAFLPANITLVETAEECGGNDFCGQVQGLIDGNLNTTTATATATFSFADVSAGAHTLSLQLVDFDGNVYSFDDPTDDPDEGTQVVGDSVDITLVFPVASVDFDTLSAGSRVRLSDNVNKSLNVAFSTNNVLLGDSETCSATTALCGEAWVNLDGSDGDQDGLSYNNKSSASPIETYFARLGEPFGTHTISISMHETNGDAIMEDGSPVMAEVEVFAISQTDPNLLLSAPIQNQPVTADPAGSEMQVAFRATQFEIADSEACTGEPCGFVKILVDGSVVVASTTTSPTAVDSSNFSAGDHTVTIELYEHNGTQVAWPYDGGVNVAETHTINVTVAGSETRTR